MKAFLFFILFILLSLPVFAQQGPAVGSVPNGHEVSTDNFTTMSAPNKRIKLFNKFKMKPDGTEKFETNIRTVEDRAFSAVRGSADSVIQYRSFRGMPQQNSIPPDPYLAVGPDHILQTVNSAFRISDKDGNTLATINADSWYASTLNTVSAFDPKVIYDHYSNRWIMVWLHAEDFDSEAYFLISVSDDENPMGTWYNWALPSNLNGSTPAGNWADYQGVGYDDKCIYITSNQFTFSTDGNYSYDYSKFRIIPKEQLYGDSPGEVLWQDFWDYQDFGVRPVRMDTPSDKYYFMRSYHFGGNRMVLFELSDPINNPSLSRFELNVGSYGSPSNADQLGGGDPLEASGAHIRNEPVYRDGYLHMTHSVRRGSGYSGVRYLKLDTEDRSVAEDFVMGSDDYYYIYPALAVGERGDVVITYSRSSGDEYVGAYYTILYAGDDIPVGSIDLQTGKANYVKTLGSGRNRWGDYMGAWTDPSDPNSIWVLTEFAYETNTYGNWVGAIRAFPFDDPYAVLKNNVIEFGFNEINVKSDVEEVVVKNFGGPDLTITGITGEIGNFSLENNITFPYNIPAYDSLVLEYTFTSDQVGVNSNVLTLQTNDPENPEIVFELNSEAYEINNVADGELYGYTRSNPRLFTVNRETAEPNLLGDARKDSLYSLTVDPVNKVLYAVNNIDEDDRSMLYRLDPVSGGAFPYTYVDLDLNAAAFDTNGALFGISRDKELYEIDPVSGNFVLKASVDVGIESMAFDPTTNVLWAGIHSDSSDVTLIYTIDTEDGTTTEVGSSGLGRALKGITFNSDGEMYGAILKAFSRSYLVSIDKTTGEASEIDNINGFNSISGLAFAPGEITSVKTRGNNLPSSFELSANYPNPFNPSTVISYALPERSTVTLKIYNSLGQEVDVLINSDSKNAGYHKVTWNAANSSRILSSGVYFYNMRVITDSGKEYTKSMKMMLLK